MTAKSKTDWSAVADKLRAMQPGDAFFLPFRQTRELTNLYNIARRADLVISLQYIELDPVEMKPGVRVTRLEGKPFDQGTPAG
ncbi:hypothetical protein JT328_gp29 [Aeromonas phage BUCT551]|uniref:Uncharacterized protein n=1 Tax=Aeromonas phage BUCT551 TaxID=2776735 RepID=A0A7L8ZKR0_9CAUD|nr:hypothetical protein JT328_gp29 [Aeromonas phage BUCT551]QOI69645.1 hypothetical protein [Aeromonas phage BUCT551]